MTSLIQDMIQSSRTSFASQFKTISGRKGGSSQDQTHTISRDPDLGVRAGSNGSGGSPAEEGFISEDEDPNLHHGNPNLSQLVMTAEEQRDFDSIDETSMSCQRKKGEPHCERFPRKTLSSTHVLRPHVILCHWTRLATSATSHLR